MHSIPKSSYSGRCSTQRAFRWTALGEGAKQRKNVDDLRRIWWEIGLVDDWRQLRRRIEVKRQRYILGKIATAVGQGCIADESAQRVAASRAAADAAISD